MAFDLSLKKYSDNKLVSLSLKNSDCYVELMRRYEPMLAAYINRIIIVDTHDIDDILQESFIKSYRYLNTFDAKQSYKNWIFRIVHNEAISFIRKHRYHLQVSLNSDNDELFSWFSDTVDLEKKSIKAEDRQNVVDVVSSLKDEYKQVIILKFYEGFSYKEISDIIEKPVGTVSTLINRAKKQFKKIYEKK